MDLPSRSGSGVPRQSQFEDRNLRKERTLDGDLVCRYTLDRRSYPTDTHNTYGSGDL